MNQTAAFLDQLADKLDGWAVQSRTGGWSTHQVTANVEAANDCRRQAARVRSISKRNEDVPALIAALQALAEDQATARWQNAPHDLLKQARAVLAKAVSP